MPDDRRRPRWRRPAAVLVLVTALVGAPWVVTDPYKIGIGTTILINVILAGTLYPLLHAGMFSIAHAAFMAVGAYGSALMTITWGLSFWLAFPLAGLLTTVVAALVGLPTLRTKGVFFLLITFGLNEVGRLVISALKITGGAEGLGDIRRIDPIRIPGVGAIAFTSRTANYYFVLALAIVTVAVIVRLWHTSVGRAWQAIGQSEELAASLGIHVSRYKLGLFCLSCCFAGLAGSFFAHYYRFLSPADFTVWNSIYPLVYLQVGGLGSMVGPVVGAAVLTGTLEVFRAIEEYKPMMFGVLLVVVMLFVPDGLIGLPARLQRVAKGGRRGHGPPAM
jgi:branched-chain amino acid transport system permease protein